MKKQCSLSPLVNNQPSELYNELLKLIHDRPTTNLIYAAYLQHGVAAKMDSIGNKRNSQNQHSAKDVYKFFEVAKMINESTDLYKAEQKVGAKDNNGNFINYTDAKSLLEQVRQFNETNTGVIASVIQHGDYFNILVEKRDSRTQIKSMYVIENQKLWEILEQVFNTKSIDINALSNIDSLRSAINASKSFGTIQYLKSLQNVQNKHLFIKDLITLLKSNESDVKVQRLLAKFGSLEDTAQKIYDSYRIPGSVTTLEKSLIDTTLNDAKKFNGLNFSDIEKQLNQVSQSVKANSDEEDLRITLKTLDNKYGIDANEIHLVGSDIKSLSQAAANAAITIQRQIKKEESISGISVRTKQLSATLKQLVTELKSQKYYAGCLNFLNEANNQVNYINSLLANIPTSGTTMEVATAKARVLMEIKSIKDAYYSILKALSEIDSIVTDENITDTDKQTLKDTALKIKEFFDKEERKLSDLRQSTMLDITIEILGDTLPNGVAISNIVKMAEADSSIFDFLYSVGRVSNPLISSMGKIIRDAQDERTSKLNAIELRIRKADNDLRQAGHNSSFMYDSNGYIISDIDWKSYNKARNIEIKKLRNSGIKGLALKEAIDSWEDANTEDRIVDFTTGRTERVPNSNYRVHFPALDAAQMKYYNEMMLIKGEIGTLLPNYAQKHYLPPQLRRTFLDAIADAKNVRDVYKAIKNSFQNIWKWREDDTELAANGVIDGEDYAIKQGALDNTPLRSIPIFYVNKIKDQNELLKDFSGALQSLASTAINYDVMSQIKELLEFMGDYIKNQEKHATFNDFKMTDSVVDWGIKIFKDLVKWSENSNTSSIIDGFINQHLYGINIKDQGKWTKFAKSLIAYTSVKGLAVNVKGAISNYLVGEMQMLIEAGAGEFYSLADYAWAHSKLFGDLTIRTPGKVMDFFTNNRNSYDNLLADIFEPIPGSFDEKSNKRYHHSLFRQLMSSDFVFMGYASGEHMIHYVTMYAILHKEKVLLNGEKISLYDAFELASKESSNSVLKLKQGITDINGIPINQEYLDTIKRRIRYANQSTHGSMNKEDKGLIHQRMLGKFVMNFRQWMVEYYSKRYRKQYYDATLNEWREGYYRTAGKVLLGYLKDLRIFEAKAALLKSEMTDEQKANYKRFKSEMAVLAALTTLSFALGEPEDHKKEFWYRMWMYQVKRLKLDVEAATPAGALLNAKTLINSPIPAINTVNGLLYPIYGLGDIDETITRGPHKGENKYWRNFKKYTVPFYNQIDQLSRMDEDETVFNIFDNSNKYR